MLKQCKCSSIIEQMNKSCNEFSEFYHCRQVISVSGNNSSRKLTVNDMKAELWEMKIEAGGA